MFQFAFGLAAAARLGTDFAMNDDVLRPIFTLGSWRSPARRAVRSVRFRVASRLSPPRVVKIDNDDDPEDAVGKLVDHVHYAGFFQSLRYFEDAQPLVRAAFEPRRRHVEAFRDRYGDLIGSPYVCCHVRRTDYEPANAHLPFSYYHECLRLAQISPGVPVVFVGDDLDAAAREFGGSPGVRLEHNDEAVDLQLLINASAVVTSNSSFGWWGGWLGRPGRPVYAPKDWFGFRRRKEIPRGIVPAGWHSVQVLD
jgi:hypothetical protein